MNGKGIRALKVRYRPIGELLPYARNARAHSDAKVDQIAASLREFGWTNPVLCVLGNLPGDVLARVEYSLDLGYISSW